MQQLYNYRFILIDFLKIMNESEKIKTHYIDLQLKRAEQFLFIFQLLQAEELLRAPEFEQEYERLYERLHILGDSWINTYSMFGDKTGKNISYYQDLLFELIYPYLSPKGKAEFLRITKKAPQKRG
jgi:hypothetical protein